ncbi:MAG: LysR family transcriptional regulator, partial [Alphaproteobacteria bacterium]
GGAVKRALAGAGAGPLPFDLRALDAFLTVAETHSMTAAAARLGLTQPAISQMVRELERQFGVVLLDRKLRPLALTVAGGMLRERAAALLEEARRIAPAVRDCAASKIPLVRIGIVDSFFAPLAPVLGVELRDAVAQLSLWSGLSDAHNAAFRKRELDIAITQDALEDAQGLERACLLNEPYVLLLPAGYRAKDAKSLSRIAAELPLIRYTARSLTGKEVERYLRRLHLDIPLGQEFDTTEGVVALVAGGLGWAITTPLCLLEAAPSPALVEVAPLPPPGIARRISLVARAGELGRVPQRIAALAQAVLRERSAPALKRMMPWLGQRFRIGE